MLRGQGPCTMTPRPASPWPSLRRYQTDRQRREALRPVLVVNNLIHHLDAGETRSVQLLQIHLSVQRTRDAPRPLFKIAADTLRHVSHRDNVRNLDASAGLQHPTGF